MQDHFGIGAFLIVLVIIIQSIVGSYFSTKNFRYFHETGVAIVLGVMISAIAYYGLDYQVKLEKRVFVYIFLPAIVFSEGYSMKKKIFFNNMCYILIYGFLGTIITFICLVVSMNYLCNNNLIVIEQGNKYYDNDPILGTDPQLSTKEIILFSAALSSKDSFLASTMVNHHAYPTLFHVLFGEGIMNDATSLVLFESFEALIEYESDFTWSTVPYVFVIMIVSLSLSILSGTIFGLLCTLILKHMEFLNKTVVHEILVVFMCSYSSYCIIEYFNLSGIISLLVSGFIIGYYAFHNLSDKAKICANVTFQTISSGAENFLFAFVGFTSFSFKNNAWSFSLIGWIILILICSRIIQVFFMSAFFSLFYKKSTFLIKFREQIVLVFTGLSRGILGFILMDQIHSEQYQDLLNSTMIGVLIITTLLFGLINPKIIDCTLPPPKHGHQTEETNSHKAQKYFENVADQQDHHHEQQKQNHHEQQKQNHQEQQIQNHQEQQKQTNQEQQKQNQGDVEKNIGGGLLTVNFNQNKELNKGDTIEIYKLIKVESENREPNDQELKLRKVQTERISKVAEDQKDHKHEEENLEKIEEKAEDEDTDYFIKKKIKIDCLLNDTYDEKLFKSKLHFKVSQFNEKYIKPFLIRDYKQKVDELIVANRLLREDKIQMMRPKGDNKNSLFISNSIKKMKTAIKMQQSQRIMEQSVKQSQIKLNSNIRNSNIQNNSNIKNSHFKGSQIKNSNIRYSNAQDNNVIDVGNNLNNNNDFNNNNNNNNNDNNNNNYKVYNYSVSNNHNAHHIY